MDHRRLARTSRLIALIGAGGVTCLVLLPITFNAATGGSAPRVLGPYATWLWPALVLLTAITAALAAWDPLSAALVQRRPAHPANRTAALERVERYVRARREGSLAEQVRLKLGVVPRVGPGLPTRVRAPLVVHGEPGAGKTSLLLDLAEALLERARADPDRPVPVVVDLGSWRRDDDFGEWLVRALARRYRIGGRLGRTWLRDRRLAVLFDGLDELPPADRADCLAWITALKLPQVVVCCSTDDYERLPRYDVVHVEPLRRNDLQELIASCGPRLDGLREALDKSPDLWDEVRTPLAFGLLALAYRAGRAEYRGVLDTYLVESAARGPGRAERALRALRFVARIARRRVDLVARHRLPPRRVWLDFVGPAVVWRLFRRAVPGALAGAATALCLVVGLRLGVVAAGVAAVAAAGLSRGRFAAPAVARSRGARWAAAGFVLGAVGVGAVAVLGDRLGGLVARWPVWLGYAVVPVVAYLVGLGLTRDRYWAVACALVPAVVTVFTGPSADLLAGLGTGLAAGAAVGVLAGGLTGVWESLPGRPAAGGGLRWLPVAGLVGAGLAAALGAGVRWQAVDALTGLVVGLAVTPRCTRSWEPVAELLAKPLALDEFPLRRKAVLQAARDRVLLVDDHRFPHAAVRDHLAECDPVDLGATVERRRAALDPTGSRPTA
ncbi:NACHT domain-containing protein [Actinosynnema sp. NPDC050436]|uniref:NACHT domain-containing protein n=1 Tax=Actinosynnema sp. NPDC050436 TaxID=3155659 RepID=UPI0033E97DC1